MTKKEKELLEVLINHELQDYKVAGQRYIKGRDYTDEEYQKLLLKVLKTLELKLWDKN